MNIKVYRARGNEIHPVYNQFQVQDRHLKRWTYSQIGL